MRPSGAGRWVPVGRCCWSQCFGRAAPRGAAVLPANAFQVWPLMQALGPDSWRARAAASCPSQPCSALWQPALARTEVGSDRGHCLVVPSGNLGVFLPAEPTWHLPLEDPCPVHLPEAKWGDSNPKGAPRCSLCLVPGSLPPEADQSTSSLPSCRHSGVATERVRIPAALMRFCNSPSQHFAAPSRG